MRSIRTGLAGLLVGASCILWLPPAACAQQVTVATPYHSVNNGFFENMGTSWGLRGRNWNLSVNGTPTQAAPQFGGFDPSAGANFGLGFQRGGTSGSFNANFSQGNRQGFVSETPSVTLRNGSTGAISDTSQSPFVVSYIPVVGNFVPVGGYPVIRPLPPPVTPGPGASGVGRDAVLNALSRSRQDQAARQVLENVAVPRPVRTVVVPEAERMIALPEAEHLAPSPHASRGMREEHGDLTLTRATPHEPVSAADESIVKLAAARSSSAGRPVPSVAEARQLRALEQANQNNEARVWIQRARNAEAKGKPQVAKVYYQRAARRASGTLRAEILAEAKALAVASIE